MGRLNLRSFGNEGVGRALKAKALLASSSTVSLSDTEEFFRGVNDACGAAVQFCEGGLYPAASSVSRQPSGMGLTTAP